MSSSPLVFRGYTAQPAERWPVWLSAWLPVLMFSAIFVVESTKYLGADHTVVPLRHVAEAIFGVGIDPVWGPIHHYLRKTGHFLGYGMFSLVCFRAFWIALKDSAPLVRRKLRAHGLAILAAFSVASADEIHQTFLPNRTGQFSDVLLDTSGAALLGFLLFLGMKIVEVRKARRELEEAYEFRAAA